MNVITIDDKQITIADDFLIDVGKEEWVGEYYFFDNGICIQVFQKPVHGHYIKIEKRRL